MMFTFQSLAQTTSINSIAPNKGFAGQIISIKGVGFTGIDRVFFGSVEGTIVSVSDQLIEAEVPSGATFDNISILNTTTKLTYFSKEDFLLSYGGEFGVTATDFDAQVDIFSGDGLFDVNVTDIDGDLKNDIVGANSKSNEVTILRNLSTPGAISFSKSVLNLGTTTLNTTSGDLNGDGKPEILFSEGDDGSRIFILNNSSTTGNLSFSLKTVTISGASTKRIIIKDLDLDGRPDLVISDQIRNKIYLVKNTSNGGTLSFDANITELTVENAVSTSGLEVEDLNGDRRPEIITNQFLTDGGGFYVATNQSTSGSFSFTNFNQFESAGTFVNLKVADLNGDNKPDIAATLFLSSATAIFLNETISSSDLPSFGSAQSLNTDPRPWGIDFGDMDGDQKKDIIVATVGNGLAVDVLNNNSSSNSLNFPKVKLPVTYINRNIKVADIDGDSKPDIVFTSVDDESNGISSSNISILRNNKCITPTITPEGPITVCAPNTVRLETQKIEGLTFEWQKDGTVVKTGLDNFIEITDATASGDYTVTIISDGGTCAETSEPVTVSIVSASALPSSNISANSPICIGGSLSLTATDVGATTYEWRGPQGFSATGISVSLNDFSFENVGRYYLDVYAGSCIIETKSVVISVIEAPEFFVSKSGSGLYCEGDPVTLTINPNDPNFNYQWYNGATPVSGATGITFNPTASGNYYAQAIDQVNSFCPSISTDTLEVDFLQVPAVDFNFPDNICSGISITFNNDSEVSNDDLASYSWDFGDGNVSSDKNPSHTYNTSGTFNVKLVVAYDGFSNCSTELIKPITINGELNVTIVPSDVSLCEGDTSILSVNNPFSGYMWNTGETSSSIMVTEEGNYSVTVYDDNGCEGSNDILIEVFPAPIVEVTASSNVISSGDSVTITATGLTSYIWSPDSVLITSQSDIIQVQLSTTTVITVEGQDANGCYGTAQVEIIVEERNAGSTIQPQKFFSPNNDAIAQYWEIEKIENFQQCGVEIYDQVGNKIYEAKPYLNDWDGTSKGKQVPDGVYYYVVRCDDEGIVKTGSITLIR